MQILFEAWKFTDEYYHLIETGVKTKADDFDYKTDCFLDKILLDPEKMVTSVPVDEIYTGVDTGARFYTLNIHFKDYCRLFTYESAMKLKQKWAN